MEAIQAPPGGAEVLALQAFQALCDANETVSAALLAVGRAAYAHTDKDVRFLLPCLHLIPRDELRTLLPLIVALPCGNMASALRRIAEVRSADFALARPRLSSPIAGEARCAARDERLRARGCAAQH